jgi:hypothetical protein
MPKQSLSGFCNAHKLPKSSVYKFLQAEGFSTSDGLSDDAIAAASGYFLDTATAAPTAPAAGGMTIDVGNHRGDLALPQPPSAIDLGIYRGDNAALTSFEPEDIERFLAAADGFMQAVDADFQHQQAVTQRKEAAAAQVRAKVADVKQASLLYQVRSETLALHNRGLDAELQQGLSTLGKPAVDTGAAG